jgi:hypothetical protein
MPAAGWNVGIQTTASVLEADPASQNRAAAFWPRSFNRVERFKHETLF